MITEIIIQTCSRWWRRQQGEEKTARLMALSRYLKQTPEMEMLTPRSAGGGGGIYTKESIHEKKGVGSYPTPPAKTTCPIYYSEPVCSVARL